MHDVGSVILPVMLCSMEFDGPWYYKYEVHLPELYIERKRKYPEYYAVLALVPLHHLPSIRGSV